MKLLVLGAAGMLGQDVLRAARYVNHAVAGLDIDEVDVTDARAVLDTVAEHAAEVVINCAAYTNVDGAESDSELAMRVNGEAAGHVARAAAEHHARVVYVSTDYVFDGEKGEPYVESDAPNPLSAYGRSKLAGEQATVAGNPRHFVVRSAWLFGAHGPNFVGTMLGLADELDEVVVVRDQVGCPTYAVHLAEALVRLAETSAYGVHHIAGSGHCSWYEFAQEIFRQAGADCRVLSCTTDELGQPAPRPAFAPLDTEFAGQAMRLPPWQEGLAAYLAERRVAT
ncbi:MAG: dTDP-4-dehydrorhamnose reductase [Thermoleophilaceae bacterium]